MYYAVIGEIIFPPKTEDYSKIQEDLLRTLDYINTYYKEDLASDLTILNSGRFRGFFKTGTHLLEILDIIQFRFRKISVRFGIGIGEMSADVAFQGNSNVEGPALEHAQKALQMLKHSNDYQVSKLLIYTDLNASWLPIVNEGLHLCDYIQGRWKSLQSLIMEITILKTGYAEPPKQTELAEIFKTSKQNINRAVRGMGYHQYIRTKREMQFLLKEHWG